MDLRDEPKGDRKARDDRGKMTGFEGCVTGEKK